jgi:membrane protein YqaA with SNARE-associated domain
MQISRWKKIALGVTGTILLGALGSAFWEVAMRPFAVWLGKVILTVATFGSTTLKDSIYHEAAKGFHEASLLKVFSLMIFIIFATGGSILSGLLGWKMGSYQGRKFNDSLADIDTESREALHRNKIASMKKRFPPLIATLGSFVLLLAVLEFIDFLELSQANSAYTFYSQSLTICRPYLSEKETQTLQAQYAGMNKRDDFIAITEELRKIASINHQKLPEYSPW